jgi:outer membrane protein TolC
VAPSELKDVADGLGSVQLPAVDPGLPSELLCRRPDMRRLEAQLAAAELDVRSLRAALLPSFSLSGEIGLGARHLLQLSSPASLFFLATGTLLQSVLDGGRREAMIEAARAKHLDLLHQYAGALLGALRDVEDALSGVRLTSRQQMALEEALQAARAQARAARRTYDAGATDAVALAEAEIRLVAGEDALESARHDRFRTAVDLYRSLGGGTLPAGRDPSGA